MHKLFILDMNKDIYWVRFSLSFIKHFPYKILKKIQYFQKPLHIQFLIMKKFS